MPEEKPELETPQVIFEGLQTSLQQKTQFLGNLLTRIMQKRQIGALNRAVNIGYDKKQALRKVENLMRRRLLRDGMVRVENYWLCQPHSCDYQSDARTSLVNRREKTFQMVDILSRTIYRKGHQTIRKQLFLNRWKSYTQAIKKVENNIFVGHIPTPTELLLKQSTINLLHASDHLTQRIPREAACATLIFRLEKLH